MNGAARSSQLRPHADFCGRARKRARGAGALSRSRRSACVVENSSKRVPKGSLADLEKEYGSRLNENSKQPTLAGFLNYLADVAFGERKSEGSFLENIWQSVVRSIVTFGYSRELPPGPNDVREIGDAARRATAAEQDAVRQLYASRKDCDDIVTLATGVLVLLQGGSRMPDALLAGRIGFLLGHLSKNVQCTITQAALMLKKAPEILKLETADIARSLVALKVTCPQADISRMVLLSPQLLCLTQEQMETFSGSASVLRRALPRVNVDRLLQEDPPLAFLDVRFALRELTELWGEEEMATIDEEELALALRSISLRPKRTHEYRLEFDATPLAKDSAAAGANGSSGGRRDGGRSGEDGGGRAGSEAPPAEEGKEAQEQKPSK